MLRKLIAKLARLYDEQWADSYLFRRRLLREVQMLRARCGGVTRPEQLVDVVAAAPWFPIDCGREELVEVLTQLQKLRPQTVCALNAAGRGTLFLLSQAAPPEARIVAVSSFFHPIHLARYPQLASAGQQLVCIQADPGAAESTRDQIRGVLRGMPLDFLWHAGHASPEGVPDFLHSYVSLPQLREAASSEHLPEALEHVRKISPAALPASAATLQKILEAQPQTICVLGTAEAGLLSLLCRVVAPTARMLVLAPTCTTAQTTCCAELAGRGQRLHCRQADPQDTVTVLEVIGNWLQGQPLDCLWVQGEYQWPAVLDFLDSYVPPLLLPDALVCLPAGEQQVQTAATCRGWADDRQVREMRALSERYADLAEAVMAVLELPGTAASCGPGPLRSLLERLQAQQPANLCVLGSVDLGLLCLLSRAAPPHARLIAVADQVHFFQQMFYPSIATAQQHVACVAADLNDTEATLAAVRRALDGHDLDFLWRPYDSLDRDMDGPNSTLSLVRPQGLVAYADGIAYTRAAIETFREARVFRQRCDSLGSLDAVVDEVTNRANAFSARHKKSEILGLLKRLEALQPRCLGIIGTATAGNVLLLSKVAAPDARILVIDHRRTTVDQQGAWRFLIGAEQDLAVHSADAGDPATTDTVRAWLGDNELDFLLIDGDHSFVGMATDFERYSPLVRAGGLIALCDIVPDYFTRHGVDTGLRTGDVPRLWAELRKHYRFHEELIEHPSQDGFGIGLLTWEERTLRMADMQTGRTEHVVAKPETVTLTCRPSVAHASQSNGMPRLIAIYLPQFHPIPENDQWWGQGFTEWRNVTKAEPLFWGHYQPHLPSDLGFYDLRLPEVRKAQAELAKTYGIHGFCYYHYWFQGAQLLERPFNEVLRTGEPDFPFCLCWANEPWNRTWDGDERHIIMEQRYSHEDDHNHIRWLIRAFQDQRYIRIDGKLLFLVYRGHDLPDPQRTAEIWRDAVRKAGLGELYLCKVECFDDPRDDPRKLGFDVAVEFQPDGPEWHRVAAALAGSKDWDGTRLIRQFNNGAGLNVCEYAHFVEWMLRRPAPQYPLLPCVTPQWDNTPRYKQAAYVLVNSAPELYERWLVEAMQRAQEVNPDDPVVFVNAWNEWAEGNHLEPDLRYGRGYLEATQRALLRLEAERSSAPRHALAYGGASS